MFRALNFNIRLTSTYAGLMPDKNFQDLKKPMNKINIKQRVISYIVELRTVFRVWLNYKAYCSFYSTADISLYTKIFHPSRDWVLEK